MKQYQTDKEERGTGCVVNVEDVNPIGVANEWLFDPMGYFVLLVIFCKIYGQLLWYKRDKGAERETAKCDSGLGEAAKWKLEL